MSIGQRPKKNIENCLKILSKSELLWSVDLIYGLHDPCSSRDCVEELENILDYSPDGLHLYNMRHQRENDYYLFGQKRRRIFRKTKSKYNFEGIFKLLVDKGYKQVGDEWCKKTCKINIKYASRNEINFHESYTLGLGVGARSRTRNIKFINTSRLEEYFILLQKGLLPIAKFFEYKNRFYLVANFLLAINSQSSFNLHRYLKLEKYTEQEKKEFFLFLKYLKRHRIGFYHNQGEIIIPDAQWEQCIALTEKYLKSESGIEYFYKN